VYSARKEKDKKVIMTTY